MRLFNISFFALVIDELIVLISIFFLLLGNGEFNKVSMTTELDA